MLAAIRPDDVNLPLFLHVAGAMVLVGALLAVVVAWRIPAHRLVLRTVLLGVLPAYVLMRIGAQWTEAQEDLPESVQDEAWIGIGYITADLGLLVVLISTILATVGLRRMRAGGTGAAQARAIGIMSSVLLVAFTVAVYAMTAKPA